MRLFWQAIVLLSLLGFQSATAHANWLVEKRHLMGTEVSVEFWCDDEEKGQRLLRETFAEIQRLDLMMNPWNPESELARINREAATRRVTTTPEIVAVIERALHYSTISEGAFDISFASVGQHYDYRAETAPDAARIAADKSNINYLAIKLSPRTRQIKFTLPGLQIDLGGIAKGYAVDRALAILQGERITSAVISAGGDSIILGDLGERARTIGIRHPRKANDYAVLIPLADTALSTSGDYERFFIADGIRYHHILDPETGRSAGAVQSASVLAPHAIDSDALSTATFVLGVERGLALINSLQGIDAIIIDGRGRMHYSDGLLRSD